MKIRTAIIAGLAMVASFSASCTSLASQEKRGAIYLGMPEAEFKARFKENAIDHGVLLVRGTHTWSLPFQEEGAKQFFLSPEDNVSFDFVVDEGLKTILVGSGIGYDKAIPILESRYGKPLTFGRKDDKCSATDLMCCRQVAFESRALNSVVRIVELPGNGKCEPVIDETGTPKVVHVRFSRINERWNVAKRRHGYP